MNSVRIAIVGVLVSNYGNEQAEGFQHFFEGWVVFIVCLALLYGVALLMRWIMRDGRSGAPLIDMPTSGLLAGVPPVIAERARSGIHVTVAALVIGAVLSIAASYRPLQHIDRQPLDQFPMELGEGRGTPQFLDSQILSILGADDYLMADYTLAQSQPPVNLLVSYYLSQTQGSGIHSPEVCIPAGGWEVSTWSRAQISLPETSGGPFTVNKAIIQKGLDRQLVYYWFEQRGRRIPSDYVAKLMTIWDSIVMGRSDGALVRLTTPIDESGLPAAEKRLQDFAGHLMMELNAYVPQ
jgi:exosortase D (VPLPA-CTERM-specific)